MDEFKIIDVSDNEKEKRKKDKFMIGIIISLVVLLVLGMLTYFFGYDLLKPYIKV